jgi:hypothetical protein
MSPLRALLDYKYFVGVFPCVMNLKLHKRAYFFSKLFVRKLYFSNEKHAVKHCQFKFTQFKKGLSFD